MSFEPKGGIEMDGMIQQALASPLGKGEMGVVLARAGVGKTACLTHIALEHLFQGLRVLHVCIDETPETIKVWYRELLKSIAAAQPSLPVSGVDGLRNSIEPNRFILAYLYQTFTPEKLEQSVVNLKEQAGFNPSLIVLDGLNFDRVPRSLLEALKDMADRHGISFWISARTHRHIETVNEQGIPYPCHRVDDLFQAVLLLEPAAGAIGLKVLKLNGRYQEEQLTVSLDPHSFLLRKE